MGFHIKVLYPENSDDTESAQVNENFWKVINSLLSENLQKTFQKF